MTQRFAQYYLINHIELNGRRKQQLQTDVNKRQLTDVSHCSHTAITRLYMLLIRLDGVWNSLIYCNYPTHRLSRLKYSNPIHSEESGLVFLREE